MSDKSLRTLSRQTWEPSGNLANPNQNPTAEVLQVDCLRNQLKKQA
jgi:hypothetical protein